MAIAGGVDLSIDPFEVLGFARNGALAKDNMLIYDKDSNGFWPGEGCGIVVLMRVEDAINGGSILMQLLRAGESPPMVKAALLDQKLTDRS